MNARSLSGINDVTSNGNVALTMNARSMSGINDTFGGGGDVFQAGNPNTFTGTNTFNTNRPTSDLATTPGSNDFITKSDGESLFGGGGDVFLAGSPNTFTGTNTFNTNRPTSDLATTPGSTDFITKQDGEALFTNNTGDALLAGGTEASPQTFTEFNKFDKLTIFELTRPKHIVPQGSPAQTPVDADFITKQDGDALYGALSGSARLAGGDEDDPQIFTGENLFEADIVFEGGVTQKDTGSVNLITQTAVGSTLNIFSQSGVNSAASTNFITQVGSNSSFNTDGTIQANGSVQGNKLTSTGNVEVGNYLGPTGHNYLNWLTGGASGDNLRHKFRFNWYNGSASQVDFLNLSGDNNCLIRARQYSNISDDRVKTNETPIENAMATLKKLNPVTYDYYGNLDCSGVSQLSAGLVAQEIWYKCPELRFIISTASDASLNHTDISNDDWGTEAAGVNYTEIQPYMIKVIQDHQTTIEKLEERLAILETKINEL